LAKASAAFELATHRADRAAALSSRRIVSNEDNERAIAEMRQTEADVAARKAELARAKLNLDYTTIRAPISGRIGAALATEGALVVQNDAASLATIQQLDPIYVDFTQPVSELHKLRHAFENGDLEKIEGDAAKVRLVFDDGSAYPLNGKLLFSEAKVNADTGQVILRGQFPNPKRDLLPGMYARVLIEQGIDSDAIAVPQQAIRHNAGGGSEVFVVKEDNTVAIQPVRTGALQDGQWTVIDGLKAGDRVVVDGFQKIAAGDPVNPNSWNEVEAGLEPASSDTTLLRQ
jgi:membrane fusion protein, multidrug efflux system